MPKYRRIRKTIIADQFFPDKKMPEYCKIRIVHYREDNGCEYRNYTYYYLSLPNGHEKTLYSGYWIITNIDGSQEIMKNSEFEKNYIAVKE